MPTGCSLYTCLAQARSALPISTGGVARSVTAAGAVAGGRPCRRNLVPQLVPAIWTNRSIEFVCPNGEHDVRSTRTRDTCAYGWCGGAPSQRSDQHTASSLPPATYITTSATMKITYLENLTKDSSMVRRPNHPAAVLMATHIQHQRWCR